MSSFHLAIFLTIPMMFLPSPRLWFIPGERMI
jgi:hypothetical protein